MFHRISALAAALVMIAACSASATGSPTGAPATIQAASPATTAPTSTPAATATPVPTQTIEPSVAPSPTIYYEVTKNGEGGHGGAPLLDLPAAIEIDYTAKGTCEFAIKVTFGVPDNGVVAAHLALTVAGPEVSGSWPLTIKPGKYYVVPSEAIGCTFHMTVRAPG